MKDLSNMTFAEERAYNQNILDQALSWSECHPMKAMLIRSTKEAIARVNHQEEKALRTQAAIAKQAAFAALPWYKKLFRSS
jgi:hypothetical protein